MEHYTIALVGWGVVGGGVVHLIKTQSDLIRERTGIQLRLKTIVEMNLAAAKTRDAAGATVTDRLDSVLADPEIDAVLELVGGVGAARDIATKVLQSGKNLITANKHLLAKHGDELFALAREKDVAIAFEAAVAGAIPIIAALRDSLVANHIESIHGILNGTCNYILTKMEEEGLSYQEALKGAQALGYAEANPAFDVNGTDTGHKIALLARIAAAGSVPFERLPIEGIEDVTAEDIASAKRLGCRIKLIACAQEQPGGMVVRVAPTMVPYAHPLASVRANFNGVYLKANAAGPILLTGQGAGGIPTASAVMADVVDLATGRYAETGKRMRFFAPDRTQNILAKEDERTAGYLRCTVADEPGVLARICTILSQHGISLAAVHQEPVVAGRLPRIEILTHQCRYGDLVAAVKEIDCGRTTCEPTRLLRLLSV